MDWNDLINEAAQEITEAFKETFLIIFKDNTSRYVDGIIDKKTSVSLKGDYAEIIDCHLSFSVPSYIEIKKELVSHIEYKNLKYFISHNFVKSEGFTKFYLKRL